LDTDKLGTRQFGIR